MHLLHCLFVCRLLGDGRRGENGRSGDQRKGGFSAHNFTPYPKKGLATRTWKALPIPYYGSFQGY
jgi:hypothetical protein